MRAALLLFVVAASACGAVDDRAAPSPPSPAPSPPAPPPVLVTPALHFPELPWDIAPSDGMKALEAAHMAPRYDEIHGYFAPPPAPPCPPGKHCPPPEPYYPAHTSEPMLLFTPRAGWSGEARFDAHEALATVSLTPLAEQSPPAVIDAERARLEHIYGASTERLEWTGGHSLVWHRAGGRLTAAIGDSGTLHVVYAREP